jgi:biopolymer transport protein ExbD
VTRIRRTRRAGARGVLARIGLEASTGIAPLIDVVLLLLLFLVLTARLVPREEQLRIGLPGTGAASAAHYLEPLHVRIDAGPGGLRITAGPRALSRLAELRSVAATLPADTPVLLDAGDEVPYETVIAAYDTVVEGGLRRIQLARPAPRGAP